MMANVEEWRRKGQLPFPRLKAEEIEGLEGTLDYPPRGSPEVHGEKLEDFDHGERLSEDIAPEEETGDESQNDDVQKKQSQVVT